MERLPIDTLRITALKLPLSDIFKFCQSNKRFQQYICNYKPFWEALFLREVNEKIETPPKASIDWYKEKIREWPSIKNLTRLIRENKTKEEYIRPFNEKWSSFEIVENLLKLYCDNNQLTSLPSMPNLEHLGCLNNQLTSLPPMPNLKELQCENNQLNSLPSMPNLLVLSCHNNQLTSLPFMPNLQRLYCDNNQLTSLPSMPNLQELYCFDNQLTFLPPMPNLQELECENNPLPGFTLKYWRKIWGYE